MKSPCWPDAIWLLRHGESAGNVARDAAEDAGLEVIDINQRDMDVPLSDLGQRQARAFGEWLGEQPTSRRPTIVLSSPYARARMTADLALEAAGCRPGDIETIVDERLREREFGVLDRLTKAGILERFPQQAEYRKFLGKFYHRPPGGESWADVVFRLRSLLMTITRDFEGERVLITTHQVVILMFRYIIERLSEQQILEIDRQHQLGNCSLTSYELGRDGAGVDQLVLDHFNFVAPIEAAGEPVTKESDAPVGPRS